jgi:phosphatidate cytidylyltransferase
MLKKRIITAAILVLITLLAIFFLPPASFLVLTGFITLIAAWEWTYLMGLKHLSSRFIYLVLIILSFVLVTDVVPLYFIFFVAFIWWLLATVLTVFYPRGSGWWTKSIFLRGLMGILVLVPCWVAINYVRNLKMGVYLLLFLLILVWGADSAAYFVGKKWGKHLLAPRVSPKKSIEGLLGGVVCAMLISVFFLLIFQTPKDVWPYLLLLFLITVLFSVIGDLFESMLKRQARLKDSSNLLPGHGGLLDRIDSLTAAAPMFVWIGLLLRDYGS